MLTKISICLFLLRLTSFDKLRRFLQGMIAFIVTTHVPLILLVILQCDPIHKYWDTQVPGSCFRKKTVEKIIIAQGGECFIDAMATHLMLQSSLSSLILSARHFRLFSCGIARSREEQRRLCACFWARWSVSSRLIYCDRLCDTNVIPSTAVVCIVRTAFSWQITSSDVTCMQFHVYQSGVTTHSTTGVGVPNAITRL